MIEVTRHGDGISIKGHAGYAPRGQDIVCASVTMLVYSLIESIEVLTDDAIKYVMSSGTTDIYFRDLSKDAQLLIKSFFVGVQMIADNYPEHVRLNRQTEKQTGR